jgi:hypothetical protein
MTRVEFAARSVGAMLAAAAADPAWRLCIDHADLREAVWQRVAPHFGLEADDAAIQGMLRVSVLREGSRSRVFTGDA